MEQVTSIEYAGARAVMGSFMDITEKKRMEEALSHSEERFKTILERMQDGYFELDLAGSFTHINITASTSLGYSTEELMGKNYRLVTPPDEQKRLFLAFNEVYRTETPNKAFSHTFLQKDGGILSAESSIDLCRNEKGEIAGFRCFSRDITERRKLEEDLSRSEQRFRTIIERMQDAYYEIDLKGNYTFSNYAMTNTLGYSRAEFVGMNYRLLVPEEDIQTMFRAYNDVYRTGIPNKGLAHKCRRKDGTIVFLESTIDLQTNEAGEVIGFRTVSRDITERKLLEEALVQSEERHRTILEEMEDAYYEVDLAGNFTFVNDSTCRDTGFTRDELIGMNYRKTAFKDDHDLIYGFFNHTYRTAEPNKGFSHRMVRKDGSIRFVEAAVSLVKNKQGEAVGFRCVSRDVTERKQMEQLLADMATHDFLTELPNRVLLIDRFEVALAQAQRKEYKLAIMSLDLDRFKEVNDTMGHSVGDEVLKQVARKLSATVRSSDTVARLGGDEFLLLLQEIHDLQDATTIAEKIVHLFKEPFTIEGHDLCLAASMGIAICPDDGKDLETLMKKSDASMYYSKRNGGCQYRVHTASDRI